ncbi:MAG: AsmA family protein [Rhizobiales bacterium]|nr:AsmA family protein [Hyphomicrobiales bacterium]MBI3674850.1 AsmA family protein [Hyphomicrobiales bacterium]
MPRPPVIAGLVIVALLAGLGVWLFFSPGWAVALLRERVQRDMGRDIEVTGGAHVEFFPELAIRIDGLRLPGPAGMDADLMTAVSLRLPASFAGLLGHDVDLNGARLEGAKINLLIDEMGRVTWSTAAGNSVGAIRFLIDDGTLGVSDLRNGQSFTLARVNAAVNIGEGGDLQAEGSAAINGLVASLQAYVKNVARVAVAGSPAELSLAVPALSLSFNGRLSTAGVIGLAGTVTALGPDLRAALQWAGGAPGGILGLKGFTLSGALDGAGRIFAVHGVEVSVDNIAAKGEMTLDYRADVPRLLAQVAAGAINLDPYLPQLSATTGDWGRAPLGFEALRGLDAAVTADTPDLGLRGLHTGPARVTAVVARGRLEAKIAAVSGSQADVMLDGSGLVPGFAAAFRSNDAQGILSRLAGISWLEGAGNLSASLTASGVSQQEMVASLKGQAELALGQGRIRGFDIVKALAAVSRAIQQGWSAPGETPFATLAASFAIADGIATVKSLKLDQPALSMTAGGDIDLLRRAVDLRADPRLVTGANGETSGLPVAVVVKGPWAAPRLYPDMADILSKPQAAYEALKAQGLPAAGGN